MYQFMCELLVNPLGLEVSAVWEYGILAVIALVALLAGREVLPYRGDDAILRWCMGLVAFVVLWAIAYAVIALAQWVLLNWALALAILAVVMVTVFALYILIKGFLYSV